MTWLRTSKRTATVLLGALIVLDLLALAAFSVRRTTVTVRTTRPAASTAPSNVSATSPSATVPAPRAPLAGTGVVAAGGGTATSTSTGHGHGTATPPPATPPTSDIPPVRAAAIGKCPVKIATPDQIGGVQSLVTFAPAFGPLSAEAFAAAAAYQPELELIGPILAQYPKAAPVLDPLLAPLLKLFGTGSNSLFDAIAPLYSPHRTEVLAAETKLAAALAPYSAKLAGSPVAGCVVDLEAALVGDAKTDAAKAHGQA